jgi:hypothetical protein
VDDGKNFPAAGRSRTASGHDEAATARTSAPSFNSQFSSVVLGLTGSREEIRNAARLERDRGEMEEQEN